MGREMFQAANAAVGTAENKLTGYKILINEVDHEGFCKKKRGT